MNARPTTLYVIVVRKQVGGPTETSLAAACARAGLKYQLLISEDIALDDIAGMSFEPQSLLYCVSVQPKASTIESALMTLHPGVFTTIYQPKLTRGTTRQFAEMIEQIAAGLPIIPSHFVDDTWLAYDDARLIAKAQNLGGFPVLFKTLGLSHGQGVQKIDSVAVLREQAEQAISANDQAIVREYLPHYRHYRLIVVADEIVAVIEYHKPTDDFRTNAGTPVVSAVEPDSLDPKITTIAVRSVELAASLLGGVDVLVDTTTNTAYLAEVNVPCNFSRAEGPTGVSVSDKLISALVQASQTGQT